MRQWAGTVAVGSVVNICILQALAPTSHSPLRLTLQDINKQNEDIKCICWSLNRERPLNPLIVFSCTSVLYIVDIRSNEIAGYLRGHGGAITSITVHPTEPHLLCTTSRDFTARIYDLTLSPNQEPNNPVWMPGAGPNRAGAAHALHMTESEGQYSGRCVAVLCAGRSGGHQAAVLGSAFHPTLPIIATCGLDRVVKIWRIPPPVEGENPPILREDKPLFSSSCVHRSRVLSINWIGYDTLLTHSAPILLRRGPKEWQEEAGEMVVWQWLSADRFFPPHHPVQDVLRGCTSDYQESASFKILSSVPLPYPPISQRIPSSSIQLAVCSSPSTDPTTRSNRHDPLILVPLLDTVRVINAGDLAPCASPPFPLDVPEVVEMTKRIRLDEGSGEGERIWQEGLGWDIETGTSKGKSRFDADEEAKESVQAACMSVDRKVVIAVGEQGAIWVWVHKTG